MAFNKNKKRVVTAALTATMLVSAIVPAAAATVSKAQQKVIQAHCTNATLIDASTLKITFSGKLNTSTVTAADFTVNGGDVTSARVSKNGLSVILKLAKKLKTTAVSDITFDLKANKIITFINGDKLKKGAKPLSQGLTIVDQFAPTLVSYKITDTDEITLTFTESIKKFNVSGADAIAAVVKVYGHKISSIKNVNGKIVIKTSEPITGTTKIELKSGQAVLTDTSGNKYAGSGIKVLVVDQVSIDLAVAKRAVDGYVEASLKTLSEVTTAEGLEATAQAQVKSVTDTKAKAALQKRINDQKVIVTTAKTELTAQKEATTAIDGYIGASLKTLSEVTTAEGLEATAQAKVNAVTDAKAKTTLQKRINDQKVIITTAKTELTAQKDATTAIDGYVGAPLTTLSEVTTAEGLEATAQAKVNGVTDEEAKAALQKRIDDQKAIIAKTKTELTAQKALTDARTALTNAITPADSAQKAEFTAVGNISADNQIALGKAYTDYTAEVTTYGKAVKAAQDANTSTASTQALTTAKTNLDDATKAFNTAKATFEAAQGELVNAKTQFDGEKARVAGLRLVQADYTVASWNALQTALSFDVTGKTVSEVYAAIADITAKQNALVIYVSALQAEVNKVTTLDFTNPLQLQLAAILDGNIDVSFSNVWGDPYTAIISTYGRFARVDKVTAAGKIETLTLPVFFKLGNEQVLLRFDVVINENGVVSVTKK